MNKPEQVFVLETIDDLQTMLGLSLELQKKPEKEIAKEIFRTMHGIKGNAKLVGFNDVSMLIHLCEEVIESSLNLNLDDHHYAAELLMEAHDQILAWCKVLKDEGEPDPSQFSQLKEKLGQYIQDKASSLSQNKPPKVENKDANCIKKVLVVDDDQDFIVVLRDAIEGFSSAGITTEVETCFNGFSAISLAIKNKYDLIITDLKMPVLDGIDFIKGLRTVDLNKTTPILFISGYFATVSAAEHKNLMENVVFIEKPFNLAKLGNYLNLFFLSQEIANSKAP